MTKLVFSKRRYLFEMLKNLNVDVVLSENTIEVYSDTLLMSLETWCDFCSGRTKEEITAVMPNLMLKDEWFIEVNE